MTAGGGPPSGRPRAALAAFAAVLAAAAVLRGARLLHAGYDGDEPFEVFVRGALLEHGVPRLPSGQVPFYGGLLLYPGALGTWIGGLDVLWNRLPFALLGLAAVAVAGRTAWRTLGPWAGVLAAALLAFDPGHVEWSANVKVYGAQTLLTALAVDRWVRWTVEDDPRALVPFAAAMCAAALTHPAAAFAVAGLAFATVVARGPRFAVRPASLAAFAAAGACLALFAWWIRTHDPGMVAQLVREDGGAGAVLRRLRSALASHGWRSDWHAAAFWVAAAGTVAAAVAWIRTRTAPRGAARIALPTFAGWCAALVSFTLLSRHLGAMYFLPSYPLLVLAAAAAASVLAGEGAGAPARAAGVVAGAAAVHALTAPPAWAAAADDHAAPARVYARFAAEAREGEVSFGGGPHAWLHSRGRVRDFMVYGGDLAASAWMRDGRPHDRYLGNPVLGTPEEAGPVLAAAPRAWYFVADKELATGRVTPEMHAWLTSRMTLVEAAPGFRLYATPR